MKSHKEIFQVLLDGKKIKRVHFFPRIPYRGYACAILYLNAAGKLVNENNVSAGYNFGNPEDWEIYEEPVVKPFKKRKYYAYLIDTKLHMSYLLWEAEKYLRMPGLDQDIDIKE